MTLPFLTPLDVPTLRAQGVPAPFAFGQADRVRFHELDALDHVNNARYLSWFETFRIAYLRSYGISDYADAAGRPVLVLRSVAVDYRAPLYLEDVYIVAGRTRAYRNTSWTMEYAVFSAGRLCATSEAVIVLMERDFVTRKRLPDTYVAAFRDRDGAVFEG
ncbi:acyl-CoA thioesterase [Jannaschia rubra]|uniref:acyl-CoA thioesterase n=1 Tax=Jannaschia rubra TaxID=282197 RepID=UPI002492562B|nr:thioesterase family protein [Jannaschia rubra]